MVADFSRVGALEISSRWIAAQMIITSSQMREEVMIFVNESPVA
jgi:hypothetical protein